MERIFQMMAFIFLFLLLYFALNSYVILRLGNLLGAGNNILYPLIILLAFSFPFAMFIEKTFPNMLTRVGYTISSIWMGVLVFLFFSLIAYELINMFYDLPYAGWIILAAVFLLSSYSVINAFSLHVKEVDVKIEGLHKDVKIVQLSDVHIGTIRNSGFLKKIAEKVNDIDPDIVMITGDLVDGSAPLHKGMFDPFKKLRAPVYLVSGNHEIYEGVEKVYDLFDDTKIKVLKNEAVNFDGIQIVGVEFSENRTHLSREMGRIKVNSSRPAVLMYHHPAEMEAAKRAGIDLMLSGHTHNGQIYPFNLLVRMVYKNMNGLYDFDGMKLYVSPGTGTWGPYMRLGSRNEITLINLKK